MRHTNICILTIECESQIISTHSAEIGHHTQANYGEITVTVTELNYRDTPEITVTVTELNYRDTPESAAPAPARFFLGYRLPAP